MYQTNDDVVVKTVVPGIRPDQVQINVTGDLLTIRGEASEEEEKTSSSQRKDRARHTPALRADASVREHRMGSFENFVNQYETLL